MTTLFNNFPCATGTILGGLVGLCLGVSLGGYTRNPEPLRYPNHVINLDAVFSRLAFKPMPGAQIRLVTTNELVSLVVEP